MAVRRIRMAEREAESVVDARPVATRGIAVGLAAALPMWMMVFEAARTLLS